MPPHANQFLPAIALRTFIVVIALVLGLKLMGKRQLGQMNIYDLVLIMLLANAGQNAMTQASGYILPGLVSSAVLFLSGWTITKAFAASPELEKRIVGSSVLLLNDGAILKENLKKEKVTFDEVMAAIRQHGLEHVNQVQMAVLETDGTISVIPKSKKSKAENMHKTSD